MLQTGGLVHAAVIFLYLIDHSDWLFRKIGGIFREFDDEGPEEGRCGLVEVVRICVPSGVAIAALVPELWP